MKVTLPSFKTRIYGVDWRGRPRPWSWSYGWGVLLLPEVVGIFALAVLVSIAGCSSVGRSPAAPAGGERAPSPSDDRAGAWALSPSQLAVMLDTAENLIGVPYRFDGETPKGFDCSGFTAFIFRRAHIELPRTADQQARAGTWVPLDEVRPGDLLFFAEEARKRRGSERLTHVGVVVSGPEQPLTMIHASTSLGVTRTEVTRSRYWRDRLRFARRAGSARR